MAAALVESHVFEGPAAGPRLIVLGAVHGNETCGTRGIERVMREVAAGEVRITSGRLTVVPVTNRKAYEQKTRNGDRNLNRNLAPSASPHDNEDRIANELCPLLAAHDCLLDLHSFSSPGTAFVMLGSDNNSGTVEPFARAREEEAMATRLGVSRAVDGWLDTYAKGAARRGGGGARYGMGTTEFMRSAGGYGVTLECGQHDDPRAPDVAHRAILNTLAHLGMTAMPAPPSDRSMEMLRLTDVIDREDPSDTFSGTWSSFDPVRSGQLIAHRADGTPLHAPADGVIVFPNPRAEPGTEWFYFAQPDARLRKAA